MKRNQELLFSKNTHIVCYGAGEIGEKVGSNLRKEGYDVRFFVDKYKQGENIVKGFNVYLVDDIKENVDRDNTLVVICLADGLLHKDVVETLLKQEFRFFIFLPISFSIDRTKRKELTRQYNYFLDGIYSRISKIEDVRNFIGLYVSDEDIVLKEDGEIITLLMDIELLCVESIDLWEGDISKIHGDRLWKEKPIASYIPFYQLFSYIEGRCDSWEKYTDCIHKKWNDETREKEIKKREKLWRQFEQEYQYGIDFFIESAPYVKFHPRGYYCLVGGHHRTCYLVHKGHKFVPVKMHIGEYHYLKNESSVNRLINYMSENNIEEMITPIPSPLLHLIPTRRENAGKLVMSYIWIYLVNEELTNKLIIDMSDMQGYIARNFIRRGAKAVIVDSNIDRNQKFIDYIFSVMNLEKAEMIAYVNKDMFCDYAFYLNHYMYEENMIDNIDKLIELSNRYIFVEIKNNQHWIINCIREKYKGVKEENLANYQICGDRVELWVIQK